MVAHRLARVPQDQLPQREFIQTKSSLLPVWFVICEITLEEKSFYFIYLFFPQSGFFSLPVFLLKLIFGI